MRGLDRREFVLGPSDRQRLARGLVDDESVEEEEEVSLGLEPQGRHGWSTGAEMESSCRWAHWLSTGAAAAAADAADGAAAAAAAATDAAAECCCESAET